MPSVVALGVYNYGVAYILRLIVSQFHLHLHLLHNHHPLIITYKRIYIINNMGLGSVVLRILANGIRVLQFLAGAVMLGIFSYFLAVLSNHHLPIAQWIRAVEGLAGAATLYALLGSIFTICLGGIMFFGLVGMVLDVCFVGASVAIAVMTRDGTQTCSGDVTTPLGNGPSDSSASGYGSNGFGFGSGETVTYMPNLGLACRLEKTVFAVSIISM